MNAEKVNSWLSLGANIGVVIGLLLVAFQINQDARLTRAQLFSDHTDSRRDWNQTMMGSDPMEVVAKSIEKPEQLTLAELQMMDMYLIAAVNELRRLEVLRQAGLDVGVNVEGLENFYFGSNLAKAWYSQYGNSRELPTVRDRVESVSPNWIVDFFDRVREQLGESSGQSLDGIAVEASREGG